MLQVLELLYANQDSFSASPFLLSVERDGLNDPGTPHVYLFPIPGVPIPPTEPLILADFWPGAGSIAKVRLFLGAGAPGVPEVSSTLMLLAGALFSFGMGRRFCRTVKSDTPSG